jgi:hypothetical protein
MKRALIFIGLLSLLLMPCLAQQIEEGIIFWYESEDAGLYISHPRYPFGTKVEVTNLSNNRKAVMQVGGRIPPGMGWIAAIPFTAGPILGVNPGDNVIVRIAPSLPVAAQKPRAIRSSLRKFNQTGVALNRPGGTELTAGHPSLSIGTKIRVTNRLNGKQLTVSIADRIRASQSRVIELSRSASQRLEITKPTEVSIESVDR